MNPNTLLFNGRAVLGRTGRFLAVAVLSAAWLGSTSTPLRAQLEPVTAPVTATDIQAQELALKTKQLELEKAKLEQTQTEQLKLKQAELELEIKKLELEKARRDLAVTETATTLAMQLKGEVLFDHNQAVIKPEAKDTLRQVALILAEFPTGKVTVTGFTDSTGTDAVNMKLSRDRAEAVKTYLLEKSGVSSERVIARGEGEDMPKASNETSTGRQLNRRVEIMVLKS